MRPVLILFASAALLGMAGCDKASQDEGQGKAPQSGQKAPGAVTDEIDSKASEFTLESPNGMKALFSRAYAGDPAPDIRFRGADGREVSLSDFRGRPLLVNIWATWCIPCKVEMPTLDELAEREAGRLSVIAVAQDQSRREGVAKFFQDTNIQNLEPYTDLPNRLSKAYDYSLQLPTTILFDAEGNELWRVTGGVEWNDGTMADLIEEGFTAAGS